MIYKQVDIRIIKFDFSTISVAYLWLLIFSENNYFSGNVFFLQESLLLLLKRGEIAELQKE